MTEAWRIDSVDARAGLAFASWRIADLELDTINLNKPAVFLSPPLFQAEALTNRAIGFGAARGSAQLGVFVGGAELAFETLGELAEFVRRVYVGSGSGDTDGGGGLGGPPPAPDGPSPEVPSGGRGTFGEVLEHPVLRAAREIVAAIARLKFEAGAPVQTEEIHVGSASVQGDIGGSALLVDGATEIVLELLRRFPLRGNDDAVMTWSQSAQSLGTAISRLDLWRDIVEGPYSEDFERLLPKLMPVVGEMRQSYRRYLLPEAFCGTAADWDFDPVIGFLSLGSRVGSHGDPVDCLAAWPLPAEIKQLAILGKVEDSAFNLLCAINANPAILADAPPINGERAWSVAVFAAANLLAEFQPPVTASRLLPGVRVGARRTITNAAIDWLIQQWPTLAFPKEVEDMIQAGVSA
ncbi:MULTISPECIES: hypothetical protein [unclassified Rhizobium]|uniref:hypothetical protein n=1 Tax=unclassified Rhizobium TaxID=2613769 RepID=UPI001AE12750|nr:MULTISPECIES: hypothetical protein [unclassified Rhizobium]MBP2461175.1 hypothetical protein [Rhizobium sp. PvP014]MBP2528571.1 hypothetical protein [Rhizobium sp. PvP099]